MPSYVYMHAVRITADLRTSRKLVDSIYATVSARGHLQACSAGYPELGCAGLGPVGGTRTRKTQERAHVAP
jgi:hypothetical protein